MCSFNHKHLIYSDFSHLCLCPHLLKCIPVTLKTDRHVTDSNHRDLSGLGIPCRQAWLLSVTPDARLIGLILRWKNLPLERQEKSSSVTKVIKPQLGPRQGRCRWVWGNYQALSDSSVPAAWPRAGDLEMWSPDSCRWCRLIAPCQLNLPIMDSSLKCVAPHNSSPPEADPTHFWNRCWTFIICQIWCSYWQHRAENDRLLSQSLHFSGKGRSLKR